MVRVGLRRLLFSRMEGATSVGCRSGGSALASG